MANKGDGLVIATRASRRGGGEAPIQIRAQSLRDRPIGAPRGPLSGFAIIPEEELLDPVGPMPRAKAGWRQRDAERAIHAAQEAGLAAYRVEIAPDGTISIVVGTP
jgi:hypothetical protein